MVWCCWVFDGIESDLRVVLKCQITPRPSANLTYGWFGVAGLKCQITPRTSANLTYGEVGFLMDSYNT